MFTRQGAQILQGAPNRVSFMTLIEVSGNGIPLHTELARVVYYYDADTKSVKRLVATKDQGFDETKAESSQSVKLAGSQDFGIEYCYKEPYAGTAYVYKWMDTWENESVVPRGVRIKIGEFKKTIFIPTGQLGVMQ